MRENNNKNDKSQIGLQLINLPYDEQLKQKQQIVKKSIRKITKIKTKVNDCIGMSNPYHYRNKIQVVVGFKAGKVISGLYKENSHEIIPIKSNYYS